MSSTMSSTSGTAAGTTHGTTGMTATSSSGIPNAAYMSFNSLSNSLNSIPTGGTVVLVSNNEADELVAVTVLRMAGYNA